MNAQRVVCSSLDSHLYGQFAGYFFLLSLPVVDSYPSSVVHIRVCAVQSHKSSLSGQVIKKKNKTRPMVSVAREQPKGKSKTA